MLYKPTGTIEVICGSMFSGKTEELIRRLKRAQIARQKVMIFKPETDNRFRKDYIVSHDDQKLKSKSVKGSDEILKYIDNTQIIAIDEGQFFDDGLIDVCNKLAFKGIRVIVAGLDMDYRGEPFGPMPKLMAIAQRITKTQAICIQCGELASYSQRLTAEGGQIVIGATKIYEARCRSCFEPYKRINY